MPTPFRTLALCGVLAAFLLVGCGGGDEGDKKEKDKSAAKGSSDVPTKDDSKSDPKPGDEKTDLAKSDASKSNENDPMGDGPKLVDPMPEPGDDPEKVTGTDPMPANGGSGRPTDPPKTTPDPLDSDDPEVLVEHAREIGPIDGEKYLQKALELDPKNRDAITGLAVANFFKGRMASQMEQPKEAIERLTEATGFVDRLHEEYGEEFTEQESMIAGAVTYNLACMQALGGENADGAMKTLLKAVDYGFDNLSMLESDEDLESLHELPDFVKLKEKLFAKAKQDIEEQLAAFEPYGYELEANDVDGKPFSMKALRGKVVIVDYWGTWCPPCRAEIPHFLELYEEHRADGLEIVGLNFENEPDPTDLIKEFAKENDITYPCVIGNDEMTDKVQGGIRGFPTTLFVDKAGKVRLKLVGLQPASTLKLVVETLLAEAAPEAPPAEEGTATDNPEPDAGTPTEGTDEPKDDATDKPEGDEPAEETSTESKDDATTTEEPAAESDTDEKASDEAASDSDSATDEATDSTTSDEQ